MAIAGEVTQITFGNDSLGSGGFDAISGEDFTFDIGGKRTQEVKMTPSGEAVYSVQTMPWKAEGTLRWSALTGQDIEKLTALSGSATETEFTFTLTDGTIYGGKGKPVGDLSGTAKDGTVPFAVQGGGILRQI